MQLTATEFAKLINDLKCDARHGERRQNPRAPTRAIVDAVCVDADAPAGSLPKHEKLRVRDISRTGMGLMINRSISDQSRIIVLLPKTEVETLTLLVQVVRTQRLPGEMYHLGAQMVRRVAPVEYSRFMAGSPGSIAALLADPKPPLTAAA